MVGDGHEMGFDMVRKDKKIGIGWCFGSILEASRLT
jgi:hypothetical protein